MKTYDDHYRVFRPDSLIIRTLFYVFRFLRRIPFYPRLDWQPASDVYTEVKTWTKETYRIEFDIAFKSMKLDPSKHELMTLPDCTNLREWFLGPQRVVAYEVLHKIRWKRLSDVLAYNQSKYIGFHWTMFFSKYGEH